jgi:hypothetical protein
MAMHCHSGTNEPEGSPFTVPKKEARSQRRVRSGFSPDSLFALHRDLKANQVRILMANLCKPLGDVNKRTIISPWRMEKSVLKGSSLFNNTHKEIYQWAKGIVAPNVVKSK